MPRGKKPAAPPVLKPDEEIQNVIPEELETVWDKDVAEAFKALSDKHQLFLLEYTKCWSKAEAYRRSYNPMASDDVASSNGSRLIGNSSISGILDKFAQSRTEALFLVQKTYNDAAKEASKPIFGKDELGQPILVMEQPDYAVRVKAAEAIAKLHGLNAADKIEHSGEVVSKIIQVNLPTKRRDD